MRIGLRLPTVTILTGVTRCTGDWWAWVGYNIESGWFVLTYALFRCKCGSYSRQKVRQLHVLVTVVRRVRQPITQVRFLLCACPCMAVWLAFATQLVVVCQVFGCAGDLSAA